ncbi:MAG: hypothetical protein ABEJ31_14305 [Haloarculaceae archaeon]
MSRQPAVLAWALGLGVFVAVVGAAVVAPPDPSTQLLVALPLVAVVVPVVYRVLAPGDGEPAVRSRPPLGYFVLTTLSSSLATVAAATIVGPDPIGLAVRTGAFLAVFLSVSWRTIARDRDRPVRGAGGS